MSRFYLIFGILALGMFSYTQYRGIGLFDDVAAKQASRQMNRDAYHK